MERINDVIFKGCKGRTFKHRCSSKALSNSSICGHVVISARDKYSVKIHTENRAVARKYFTLLQKAFKIDAEISIRQNVNLKNSRIYTVTVNDHISAVRILQATRLMDENQEI